MNKCRTCRFADDIKAKGKRNGPDGIPTGEEFDVGLCRIRAPKAGVGLPTVALDTDWCGEYMSDGSARAPAV